MGSPVSFRILCVPVPVVGDCGAIMVLVGSPWGRGGAEKRI
jgi:hypothetical protein